jgi:hypothetical protein
MAKSMNRSLLKEFESNFSRSCQQMFGAPQQKQSNAQIQGIPQHPIHKGRVVRPR